MRRGVAEQLLFCYLFFLAFSFVHLAPVIKELGPLHFASALGQDRRRGRGSTAPYVIEGWRQVIVYW